MFCEQMTLENEQEEEVLDKGSLKNIYMYKNRDKMEGEKKKEKMMDYRAKDKKMQLGEKKSKVGWLDEVGKAGRE